MNDVSAKSPSDAPRPVKSKRSTAMPWAARAEEIRAAACDSRLQVKQWANTAVARGAPTGRSRVPTSSSHDDPGKRTCSWVGPGARPGVSGGVVITVLLGTGRRSVSWSWQA